MAASPKLGEAAILNLIDSNRYFWVDPVKFLMTLSQ